MNLLRTVSSQLKVRLETPLSEIESRTVKKASCFRNEPFSFQVLYRFTDVPCWKPVSISVKTSLPIQVYRVDYASVTNAANDYMERGYVGNDPGLYPNPLMPRSAVPELCTLSGENKYEKGEMYRLDADPNFRSLWVSINPYSAHIESGIYDIEIELISLETGKTLEKDSFTLEVADALLPPHNMFYTNWFHVDCLCDYYGVEPYTDEFYGYFESFIKNASMHRQNTLLIPAFTPALDTPVGSERRNVQLVDVEVKDGGYIFGFEKLERFLRVADSCGITYFEHCHLFSQWGAKYAPNIYDVDGKRIFGWETSAQSSEYGAFLKAYLTELLDFAERMGYGERFIFHISDEPPKDDMESFLKATEAVRDVLKGKKLADALSYIDYYRQGIVTTPIAFIPHAEEFSAECKDLWLYYTCGTYGRNCSNRLITNTPARTRVLGLQLYYYGAKGFLHWGYNYYYNVLSTGYFDPMANPCGYKNVPGASYLAYPTRNGAVPSVCEKLMCEAFDDVRALELLESYTDKRTVIDFCEKMLNQAVNYTLIPENEDMFVLRQKINEEIKKYI